MLTPATSATRFVVTRLDAAALDDSYHSFEHCVDRLPCPTLLRLAAKTLC